MKTIALLILALLAPCCLKAQSDPTLGKTKEQIRALIQPISGITLLPGDNSDTLTMQGGLKTIMLYKNNSCYASKSIMPLKYMSMTKATMAQKSYKKINENEWINAIGTVKVEIALIKNSDFFSIETSQINKE